MLVTPHRTATHSDRWRVIDTYFPPWIAYMTFRNIRPPAIVLIQQLRPFLITKVFFRTQYRCKGLLYVCTYITQRSRRQSYYLLAVLTPRLKTCDIIYHEFYNDVLLKLVLHKSNAESCD